jgi:hypothetical protein
MTLEEKIGQLNQYNGFWEITGPSQKKRNEKRTKTPTTFCHGRWRIIKHPNLELNG